ncbi:NPC intracellular cholesterol transporter 1 [Nymphon striatum]|nr:NPC intracellular cholesterol transporter 1 [Nymphon striatum]
MYDASAKTNNAPFVYKGEPKLLTDKHSLSILKKYAPTLYKGPNSTRTCCSKHQVSVLNMNTILFIKQLFRYCPTCFYNINQPFYYMVCAPDQSRFMKLVSQRRDRHLKKDVVTKIEFYLSDNSAQNIIQSCKSVHTSSAGLALAAMCGSSVDQCTPKTQYSFASKKSPFIFDAIFNNYPVVENGTTFIPLKTKWYPCSAEIDNKKCPTRECLNTDPITMITKTTGKVTTGTTKALSSVHTTRVSQQVGHTTSAGEKVSVGQTTSIRKTTTQAARTTQVIQKTEQTTITASVHKVKVKQHFNFKSLDAAETAAVGIAIAEKTVYIEDKEEKVRHAMYNESMLERVQAESEDAFRRVFCKWGTIAARHPYIVIASSIVICAILSCGMLKFQVITDPVELWAAPHSKSRVDKEYFDKHFGPFYRTEVIIIKPIDQSSFNKTGKVYGPVFRKQFLLEVLQLQSDIQNITATFNNKNVTLEDVCFRPMFPEYQDCTIQSALNYFQNNFTKLSKPDYLEHLQDCLTGYISRPECFGSYGGPIQPEVVLGGFSDKKYNLATALVITFVNDNSLDKSKVEKVKAWELQ